MKNLEVGYYISLSKNDGNKLLDTVFKEIETGGNKKNTLLNILDCKEKGQDYSGLKKTLNGITPSGTLDELYASKIIKKYNYSL